MTNAEELLARCTELTEPPVIPIYSMHGYIVCADGKTYTLLRQWYHGAVLAMLYPKLLETVQGNYGFDYETCERIEVLKLPTSLEDIDVFKFQRFEFEVHSKLPDIRVCASRMMGSTPVALDAGCEPATPQQIAALRFIFKALGLRAKDVIVTDHMDMKVKDVYAYLTEPKETEAED